MLEAVDDMQLFTGQRGSLGFQVLACQVALLQEDLFLPSSQMKVSYEETLNVAIINSSLTDGKVRKQIADMKKKRASYSVDQGAPKEWAQDFCEEKVGWIITPMRAHLLSLFSFHGAIQVLTGRDPLARTPKGIVIDVDSLTPVQVKYAPENGWDYATL